MLNPSTADAEVDDPTIRRCMAFAKLWGFCEVEVRNLYALRSTDPKKLFDSNTDPVGPKGNIEIVLAGEADLIVAAWGNNAENNRVKTALRFLRGKPLYCLGLTKMGQPKHPLYVERKTKLTRFA